VLKKIVLNVILGVIRGFVEYLVYFRIPLLILTDYLKVPVTPVKPLEVAVIFGVFVALNTTSSNVKPQIGIVFDALSSLLGLLIVLELVFGTMEAGRVEVVHRAGELQVRGELVFRPLVILLVGFAVLFTIVRLYEKIVHSEE